MTIAEKIIAEMADSTHISKVEIAGPGFINFYLTDACRLYRCMKRILKLKHEYRQPAQLGEDAQDHR